MIQVENVGRTYGDIIAVKDVSFEIPNGEVVGLLGHNGAGKTTLMKMITGYLEPSSGKVMIAGEQVTGSNLKTKSLIGYLPENLPLYPEMSIVDYLDYVADLRGISTEEKPDRIREAIDKTELLDRALQPISTLSRGYRQRVGVAQAIIHNPKILILDEPTNGLDPSQTQQMRELIQALREQATVILSTHIMQEVEAMCDRVIMIKQGELALDTSLSALGNENHLLIKTDKPESNISNILKSITGINSINYLEESNGCYNYQLVVDKKLNTQQVSAQVAKSLINADAALYSLQAEQFDLETVFHRVNSVNEGGSVHAA